jgi:ADP-ribosylglycohydrolase
VLPDERPASEPELDRVRGMLLGGALGDALGNPVEFLDISSLRAEYGPDGITSPAVGSSGSAEITDDTQLTLFTLEGLIRGHHRLRLDNPPDPEAVVLNAVHAAYLRWLHTQHETVPAVRLTGSLITHSRLFVCRSPGNTCLTALRATSYAGAAPGSIHRRLNDSKGCGAVMRAAPAGLWPGSPEQVFQLGVGAAALTHSHPTGYLAAGTFAVLIRELLSGRSLTDALTAARAAVHGWPGHEDVLTSLDAAQRLADRGRLTPADLTGRLGGGWVAEEALGIAVCSALCARDFADGVRLAVNHSGDSDSTGAIAGNILGAQLGYVGLPPEWLETLELREVIDALARDAVAELGSAEPEPDPVTWRDRYPPD